MLSISIRGVDYLIATKRLSTRRIANRVLIPIEEIRKFARSDHPERTAGSFRGGKITEPGGTGEEDATKGEQADGVQPPGHSRKQPPAGTECEDHRCQIPERAATRAERSRDLPRCADSAP